MKINLQSEIISFKNKLYFFILNSLIIIIVVFAHFKYQEREIKENFYITSKVIEKQFSNKIATIKGVITSIGSYYKSTPLLNSSSFSILGSDLISYYDYIDGMSFATVVEHDEKESFLQEQMDLGFYDFKLRVYDDSRNLIELKENYERYAPIIYIEPASYKYTKFYGYDVYNDKIFNNAFIEAAKSDDVVIKDMLKNKIGGYFHFFIKATYKGSLKRNTDEYRLKNVNGFYVISINLENIISEVRKTYKNFVIKIIDQNKYEKIEKSESGSFRYIKKVDGFERSYLVVEKKQQFRDFYLSFLVLSIFFIIVVQFLYVYVWYKDKLAKRKLKYEATHDSLTKSYNRNYFKELSSDRIKINSNNKNKKAFLFIDIDKFKEINDSFGHAFGDEVLIDISKRINSILRSNDIFCRHGGDEFLVLLDDIKDIHEIEAVVNRIMFLTSEPISYKETKIHITLSIGISVFPNDGNSIENLLKFADSAMFKAKDEGRNTFKFYNSKMTDDVLKRVIIQNKLQDAIKNDEFIVFYQPQINSITNDITGLEALVRWVDKDNNIISPAEFIDIAEDSALIIPIDRIVIKKAIKQFSIWKKRGLRVGKLSLNLSAKELKMDDFLSVINDIVKENRCSAHDIELEITESSIIENPNESIQRLEEIKSHGYKIALDDFGTGYSSLTYLKRLPIDKLKIDKSFVDGLPDNEQDVAICSTIITLAKNLRLDIIAEGVENSEQKDLLVKSDCVCIQGYFYAKPMGKEDLEKFIDEK